nr:retrovirus-related Pol polyprotein from transposon TNT 1-94 [Tanacetum cinerariifolium]
MCHIIGIEPQFENIIKNGPFIPMVAGQKKPEGQSTADERKAANFDQRLKSIIMFILPDDQMNSIINCLTAKSTWDDLILYHKGPSDVKKSRVMDLKLCYNTFKFKEAYEWDEEKVLSDENQMVEVKVLMALAKDNDAVNKQGVKNDLVFIKSSADDTKVTIPGVERPWLSEAEGLILPNHDIGRILLAESQRNINDPLVVVTDSSATDYDSVDKSSVYSTPIPPLKKLDGAEPISGPKIIKSILRSKSRIKADTLKGVIINEPSSAHLAPAGKLKNVKIKDAHPLAIVMKELNNLKPQFSKNKSSYSQAPQDRWSQDKHIELVNIIGNLGAGMLTRAMAKQLSAASAHECLFVDFLTEKEPKKIAEALKYLAFGRHLKGNTRDLGSFREETNKTTDLHQHFSRLCSQRLETTSQDIHDAVTIHPMTVLQESMTASARMT